MTHNNVADRIRQLKQYREQLASDFLLAIQFGNYDTAEAIEAELREVSEQLVDAFEKQNTEGERN